MLVVSEPFGDKLPAARVAESIARGLRAGGLPAPDVCPLPSESRDGPPPSDGRNANGAHDARELLDALGFDARMRAARAVVVAVKRLREQTLAASTTFELATRARQSGVPAYAVTAENLLDDFDARILDLQAILEAGSARALTAAGRKLAALV